MDNFEKIYGLNRETLKAEYGVNNVAGVLTASGSVLGQSPEFYAISILSDAQHVAEYGSANEARQFINRAKFLLAEAHNAREANRAQVKSIAEQLHAQIASLTRQLEAARQTIRNHEIANEEAEGVRS